MYNEAVSDLIAECEPYIADLRNIADRLFNGHYSCKYAHGDIRLGAGELKTLLLYRYADIYTMSDLSRNVMVKMSRMSKIVDDLAAAGLVQRAYAVHDRRVVHVSLTEQGAAVMRNVVDLRRRDLAGMLEGLDTEKQSDLVASLKTIRDIMSRAVNSASACEYAVDISAEPEVPRAA